MSRDERGSSETVVPARLVSVDVYRGFVMFLMMAEVLRLSHLADSFPGSPIWQLIAFNTTHVEWVGCSLHDMIQPSFSFLVGVALPFSLANRAAKGESRGRMALHALWRSVLLVLLGVFLRSMGKEQTNWTFEDTLSQIGLGYIFLFVFGFCTERARWGALTVILVGYWAAWALYPLPGPDFDYERVKVPADWSHHANGFAAHWNKNSNLGAAFDQWFLNLFPRPEPFVANGGGYLTLSFIPTLGTMVLGLIAGGWLRQGFEPTVLVRRLLATGVAAIVLGLALHLIGACPIVKRIWTPTWALVSGGLCFLFLAAFYAIVDVRGWQRWSFPLKVIGMNSIAAYCIAHLFEGFIVENLKTHLGQNVFAQFGESYGRTLEGAVVLLVFWLILYWMFRRGLFLKV